MSSGDAQVLRNVAGNDVNTIFQPALNARCRRKSVAEFLIPELLAEVMLQVMIEFNEAWLCCNTMGDYAGQSYSWIGVTHVCRHWRDVALHTAHLWSAIEVRDLDLLQLVLPRSREVPLCVSIRWYSEDDAVKAILQALPRIERFCISDASDDVYGKLTYIDYQDDLPLLRYYQWVTSMAGNYDNSVPAPVFSKHHQVPGLQVLVLDNCSPIRTMPMIQSSLTLLRLKDTQLPQLDMDTLLDALEQIPLLWDLALEDVIPEIPLHVSHSMEALPTPSRSIILSRLHSLRLRDEGDGVACAILLSHLVFPASATITFRVKSQIALPQSNLVAPQLRDKWAGQGLIGPSSPPAMFYLSNYPNRYPMEFGVHSHTLASSSLGNVRLYGPLRIGWLADSDSVPGMLGYDDLVVKLTTILPTSRVEKLWVECAILPASTWCAAFGHMQDLVKICVKGLSFHTFPFGLRWGGINSATQQAEDAEGFPAMLFPKLKTLIVEGVYFKMPSTPTYPDANASIFDEFLHALRLREERNMQLQKLTIRMCSQLSAGQLRKLRDVVDTVIYADVQEKSKFDLAGMQIAIPGRWPEI